MYISEPLLSFLALCLLAMGRRLGKQETEGSASRQPSHFIIAEMKFMDHKKLEKKAKLKSETQTFSHLPSNSN